MFECRVLSYKRVSLSYVNMACAMFVFTSVEKENPSKSYLKTIKQFLEFVTFHFV